MPRKTAIVLSLVVVLLALVGGGSGARAQGQTQATITVMARAGYGDTGAYLIGEWVPVRVTLSNPAGGNSLRVSVQVESKGADDSITAGEYARDVDLPSPSRKELTLYAFSGAFTRSFHVKVMQSSTIVASADAAADPFEPPTNTVVGVVSSDASLLNSMKGEPVGHILNPLPPGGYGNYGGYVPPVQNYSTGATSTLAHMKLDDIPALSQALDSLGAIVLDDVDTGSLSDEQRGSLEAWVSRGGTLIVTARPGGADTTAGIAGMMPVTVAGSRTVSSLKGLEDLLAVSGPKSSGVPPINSSGQANVGDATLRPEVAATSRVLAAQDGVPLVVERDLGDGHVVYLGLSPGLTPLKGWDGTLPLMKRLLADRPLRLTYGGNLRFTSSRGYYGGSLYDMYGGMFAMPSLDLPSPWVIGGFLLLYIIIIGPVNFIVLRRMRRTELAWVTVPVLVGLFSVVAYAIAFQSKGGDLVAIRANAILTYPDVEQATSLQHFGLFSPVRRTYTLRLPADSVITEMNSNGYYQTGPDGAAPVTGGNPTTINNVNINTWSLRGFVAEHTDKVQSPVETHLSLGDNVIVGTVKNRTNAPLQDVALVRGDAVRYIGYLAPGQQIDVRLNVSGRRFDNSSPSGLLPLPRGVATPVPGYSYYPYPGTGNNTEQRTYYRKTELLSAALYRQVADAPPLDMSVIVVAWGPPPPNSFEVEGHSTSSQELNVWTSVAPVGVGTSEQPSLHSGLVPYTVYAPGNSPQVIAWNGGNVLPNPQVGGPGGVPTVARTVAPSIGPGFITPTPAFQPGGYNSQPLGTLGIHISPYADVQFRLPAGTQPDSLTFSYSIGQIASDGDIDLLAYNVDKSSWDRIDTWTPESTGRFNGTGSLSIPNPTQYTATSGDVTLRLQPKGTDATLADATLNMALNEK